MKIIATILLIICIGFLLLCIYFLKRNDKVYAFRMSVLNDIRSVVAKKIEEGTITSGEVNRIYGTLNAVSYEKMLHSFKPLKVEYWYTEEELKIMGYEKDI